VASGSYRYGMVMLRLAAVLLEDETEAVQCEPGLVVLNAARVWRDEGGESARRDHVGFAGLVLHERTQPVDLRPQAVDGAGLDRRGGVLADDVAGLDELDGEERSRARVERVEADVDAGQDRAAEVLTLGRDRFERRCRAEVDDDRRPAVQVV